jgi:hypothetical protein
LTVSNLCFSTAPLNIDSWDCPVGRATEFGLRTCPELGTEETFAFGGVGAGLVTGAGAGAGAGGSGNSFGRLFCCIAFLISNR